MLACFVMTVATISDSFSQLQNHILLEFQRIKTFQTIHQGSKILASPSKIVQT